MKITFFVRYGRLTVGKSFTAHRVHDFVILRPVRAADGRQVVYGLHAYEEFRPSQRDD